jgi:hypothetical protein
MGLSEAEAVIAAGVDRSVASGDVNRAFNSGVELGLFEAAKALGLTEAEAKIFADPTSRVSSSDGADGVKLKR